MIIIDDYASKVAEANKPSVIFDPFSALTNRSDAI